MAYSKSYLILILSGAFFLFPALPLFALASSVTINYNNVSYNYDPGTGAYTGNDGSSGTIAVGVVMDALSSGAVNASVTVSNNYLDNTSISPTVNFTAGQDNTVVMNNLSTIYAAVTYSSSANDIISVINNDPTLNPTVTSGSCTSATSCSGTGTINLNGTVVTLQVTNVNPNAGISTPVVSPLSPTLSISPSPTTGTTALYTTNDAATISWVAPPQPAGVNYYIYVNGGAGVYAGCTRSLGGCPTSLTGATGLIGDAFMAGTGRFVEVEACNSAGQCSATSNRITFDVSPPAQNVTYTILQTPIPEVNSSTVFPMATSRITPLYAGLTVPDQTSVQLTLYYSPDGGAESPVTSGVIWYSNSSATTVSNGLVSTSVRPVDNCISGTPNCYLLQKKLDTAQISAVYQDKFATSWVEIYGSAWTFAGGEGGNQ